MLDDALHVGSAGGWCGDVGNSIGEHPTEVGGGARCFGAGGEPEYRHSGKTRPNLTDRCRVFAHTPWEKFHRRLILTGDGPVAQYC